MNRILGIVQLRTFVEIAESGGFGRAAETLSMSQPTVSQHVRQLEQVIGQPLVQRRGRRAVFTSVGEQLVNEARVILRAHDEALARLGATLVRPTIVIGSTETAADELLPQLLSTMKHAFPERAVQFRIGRSTGMTAELDRGAIDIAVMLGFDGGVPGSRVGALPLRWFSAPGHEPAEYSTGVALVAYSEPCGMRQRALQALTRIGTLVEVAAESGTLEGVIAGARAGLGVSVLPSAGRVPQGLVEVDGLPPLGTIGVHLAARRGVEAEIVDTAAHALEGFFEREAAPAAA